MQFYFPEAPAQVIQSWGPSSEASTQPLQQSTEAQRKVENTGIARFRQVSRLAKRRRKSH